MLNFVVYLGLQQKLRWVEKSERWAAAGNVYEGLHVRTIYKKRETKLREMTGLKWKHHKAGVRCDPYC